MLMDGERKLNAEKLDYIAINDLLQVKAAEDTNSSNYRSRVNDIAEGKIIIAWPTQSGIRLPVRSGQELKFTFLHNDIPYEFNGVTEETTNKPLPQITITPVGFVIETQRRKDFRLKCLVPVQINGTVGMPDSKDEAERNISIQTETFDMSAGGISIRYSKNIHEGTLLEAKLELPDEGPLMKIPCRVIYSEQTAENLAVYHMGIKFLAVTLGEQARIFRYLQRLQLQRLRGS